MTKIYSCFTYIYYVLKNKASFVPRLNKKVVFHTFQCKYCFKNSVTENEQTFLIEFVFYLSLWEMIRCRKSTTLKNKSAVKIIIYTCIT